MAVDRFRTLDEQLRQLVAQAEQLGETLVAALLSQALDVLDRRPADDRPAGS